MNIYKLFLDNIPWPVWIGDTDTRIIILNKKYEEMYDVNAQDVIGKTNVEVLPEEEAKRYNKEIRRCLETPGIYVYESIVKGVPVECYLFPLLDEKGKVQAIAGIVIEISTRKEIELELQNKKSILRTIIDAVPDVIFYKDKDGRFIEYNKSFEEFYKKKGIHDIVSKTDIDIYEDKEVAEKFIEQDREILRNKETKHFEYIIDDGNGNINIEENLKIPVIDDSGNSLGVVGWSRNITERKVLEDKLRHISETDMLTGLYNRYSFEEKIKELNYDEYLPLGIIMGDVNGLKLVNDTLGHIEGDKILKDISMVLKGSCGENGHVFRWGGDEFMILIPNCDEYKCEQIINKIIDDCKNFEYKFMQLSIALGESVKYSLEDDVYECIAKVEEKLYRQKILSNKSIKSSILKSIEKTLQDKNLESSGHTNRVKEYSIAIGKRLNFKISELDELGLAASLHDIGKICINENILLKPGKLTKEEDEIVKTHSEKGYKIISASSGFGNVGKYVLTHHERWDGKGYPLGLKGREIPLISRIISVADSYDVMTQKKIYKNAMSQKESIEELKRCSGTQFDPKIVDVFVEYLGEIENE